MQSGGGRVLTCGGLDWVALFLEELYRLLLDVLWAGRRDALAYHVDQRRVVAYARHVRAAHEQSPSKNRQRSPGRQLQWKTHKLVHPDPLEAAWTTHGIAQGGMVGVV